MVLGWPPSKNVSGDPDFQPVHFGRGSEMTVTLLEGDHPRIISGKFGWDWLSSFREDFFLSFIPPFSIFSFADILHKNLLFRNHWVNCNQTLVEWSLDDPLPKRCPVIPTSNQDIREAKNRNQWLFHQNLVLIEQMVSDKKIVMGISYRVLC
jgi:hypothetical protein